MQLPVVHGAAAVQLGFCAAFVTICRLMPRYGEFVGLAVCACVGADDAVGDDVSGDAEG
jgi:hypothetical protein